MSVETSLNAYVEAWNTADDDTRAALLARAVTDDCVLQGPTGTFVGRAALVGLITSLRDRLVGASVVRKGPSGPTERGTKGPSGPTERGTKDPDAGGPGPRFAWEIRSADGALLFAGEDEFEVAADGRLSLIRVLF